MKKIFLVSVISIFCAGVALASDMLPAGGYYETESTDCDMNAMRAELDRATAARRAVITVVRCAPRAADRDMARDASYDAGYVAFDDGCMDCAAPIERVIDRRVYVEETVQQYRPVLHYVPAGTYSRTRQICNECDI